MNYWLLLIPFLFFVITWFVFPKVIRFAMQKNIVDEAKGRKRHTDNVPPIGGWLIFAAFICAQLFLFPISWTNLALIVSISFLFALGFIDDRFPLDAKQKFLGQFLVAFILVFLGQYHFAGYMNLYGVPILIGKLFCMVALVFIINAFNLVDGINGLAALLGLAALISFGLWMYFAGEYNYVIFTLTIIASIVVFLRYNLFDTKVFLGDNGSMLIGLIASVLAIVFVKTYTGFEDMVVRKCDAEMGIVFAALAIPIIDTVRLFILRPYYLKKSPFKADRNHVHHLLLRIGFNHVEASLLLFGFAIFLVMVSLAAQDLGSIAVILITIFLSIAFMMSIDYFVYNKYKKRINKKTLFNSLQNLSKDLNYPVFLEYVFATSFFILAMAIPFHRVSTSIPTIIVLFSFITLLIRSVFVYRSKGWANIYKMFIHLLKQPYTIVLLLNLFIIIINVTFINPTKHWTKLFLYALPLVYWFTISQLERTISIKPRALLTAYIIGLFGFAVFILMQAFVDYPKLGWDGFFYHNLLHHVLANPLTHSLYFNLGILFIGNNFKTLRLERWRVFFWAFLALFVVMIILCRSKLGLFVLPISLSFALYNMINNKKTARWGVAIFLSLFFFIAYQYGALDIDFIIKSFKSRLIAWQESFKIINDYWLTGVGVGNGVEYLNQNFKDIGYEFGVRKHIDAQNQFIESFLELGVFGFIGVVSLVALSFIKSFYHKNTLYFYYILIILIYMFFESLFQTQMGIVAFAFFNALFLANFYKKSIPKST